MTESVIQIEKSEGICTLTINRPMAMNALNGNVFDELEAFFTSHLGDYSIKGVIITGAGEKAFVAGADIKEFGALDAASGAQKSKRGQDVFFMIERFHAPVIAAVNGFALGGGCELAMSCHIRVAGANAKFGQPEVNLGLIPGYGGSQRLIQLIGKGKALEMLLTADMIDAAEAYRLGLATHVVEAGEEVNKAKAIIHKIATKGPLAVEQCIQLVNAFFDKKVDGYQQEYEGFGIALGTEDSKEGATAFVEKRKPVFQAK